MDGTEATTTTKKCEKCGQKIPEAPYYPVIDIYGTPIKIEHLMLDTVPRWIPSREDNKVTFEFEPRVILLDRIEWDLFTRRYLIQGRYLRTFGEYEREGDIDKPVPDLISLSITHNDYCRGEVALAERKKMVSA